MKRLASLLGLSATLLALAGCGRMVKATRPVDITAPIADYDQIVVDSRNGSVELSRGGEAIRISGEKHARGATREDAEANVESVEVVAETREGGVFAVELRYPESLREASPGAQLKVSVPAALRTRIRTSNGAVVVRGMRDEVVAETSNGPVRIEGVPGMLRIDTSNGPVTIRDVQGNVTAQTSNSSIEVQKVAGACELETSNGSVKTRDVRGDLTVTSSNGRIDIEAAPAEDGKVLRTSNSSIAARLPAAIRGELELATSNGRVESKIAEGLLQVTEKTRTTLRGFLNGGGDGKVVARSSNGLVKVTWY